jgi:Ca-activated chloride channel family protein
MSRSRSAVVLAVLAVVLLGIGAVTLAPRILAQRCLTLMMYTSDEKYSQLETVAQQFADSGAQVDGQCVRVKLAIPGSANTADLLAGDPNKPWDGAFDPPDIWSPSSSVWVERLRAAMAQGATRVRTLAPAESLVTTPVVIGMPEPMARALGWPDAAIGWKDLVALAGDPRGWASKGHPEWGRFKLGKTNPEESPGRP